MTNTKEYMKQYYIDHKEYFKKYRQEHKKYNKEYEEENKEHRKELHKIWIQKHKNYLNLQQIERIKTDLKYNLNRRMSSAIRISIKGNKNGRHWEDLVGYKLIDLIEHLKSTIPEGYYWNDFLQSKLHIDHIIPISVCNFTQPGHIDFKRCWALKNLRLLPARENFIKNNLLIKPFQPALKLLL